MSREDGTKNSVGSTEKRETDGRERKGGRTVIGEIIMGETVIGLNTARKDPIL